MPLVLLHATFPDSILENTRTLSRNFSHPDGTRRLATLAVYLVSERGPEPQIEEAYLLAGYYENGCLASKRLIQEPALDPEQYLQQFCDELLQ